MRKTRELKTIFEHTVYCEITVTNRNVPIPLHNKHENYTISQTDRSYTMRRYNIAVRHDNNKYYYVPVIGQHPFGQDKPAFLVSLYVVGPLEQPSLHVLTGIQHRRRRLRVLYVRSSHRHYQWRRQRTHIVFYYLQRHKARRQIVFAFPNNSRTREILTRARARANQRANENGTRRRRWQWRLFFG